MRLIPSTFGLDDSDPYVPPCIYAGTHEDEKLQRTFMGWCSELPAAADESVSAFALDVRAEATVEHAEFATGITQPWRLHVDPEQERVLLIVEVSGPTGWVQKLSDTGMEALAARAQEITTTAWAAWHASGAVYDPEQVTGVLWLTAAGHKWDEAVSLTASLAHA